MGGRAFLGACGLLVASVLAGCGGSRGSSGSSGSSGSGATFASGAGSGVGSGSGSGSGASGSGSGSASGSGTGSASGSGSGASGSGSGATSGSGSGSGSATGSGSASGSGSGSGTGTGSGTGSGAGTGTGTLAPHPRIWLDSATLTTLRSRARAGSSSWTNLRAQADAFALGTVEYPDGNAYPNGGDIGEGYQGSGYFDPLLDLALAYQIAKDVDPGRAASYAAKGIDVLMKMSDPAHSPSPTRDDGYGVRFYGVGMAIGYDWLHDQLAANQLSQIDTALQSWIGSFDNNGFGRNHPQGNYFAGYYCAKGLAGLALQGDDPAGATMWSDWLGRLHGQMVQPYYAANMKGGGWPEGWNYGPLGTLNMIYPVLAAKTALGLDLVHDPQAPFAFPLDQGTYLVQFAWPSRTTLDDRGMVYGNDDPTATTGKLYGSLAGILDSLGAPEAPTFHHFAREVRALHGPAELWQEMLWWDDAAPEQDEATLPLSDLASGMGLVTARSSWQTDAVWCSFSSGPYVGNPDAGEEFYDQGGLAIVRGQTPLLVNATSALVRNTPGTQDGSQFETPIYDDNYGDNATNPALGNRTLYNIFYVAASHYGQDSNVPGQARTHVSLFEDGGGYVLARGSNLEDMYRLDASGNPLVASWTRDVLYLRPGRFVVYDRTRAGSATADEWLAFHLSGTPVAATAPSSGASRFDVTSNGTFAGSVTTLLPAGAPTKLVNVFNSGKVSRLEVRPAQAGTDQRWLTVFDAATQASDVAPGSRLSAQDGNVLAGSVLGAVLDSSAGLEVAVFGSGDAGQTVAGEVRYTVAARGGHHVIADLPASTGFTVQATVQNGTLTVSIAPGSGFQSSAAGVLDLAITAAGAVTKGP